MTRADAYPLGFFGIGLGNTLFTQWIVRFHEADARIGAALLAGFLVQAALNPWIGSVADRSTHRWGRRRPFVLLGVLPFAAAYLALWRSRDPAWGVATVLLYTALYAVVTQPYVALLPTLAPAGPRRVRLTLTGALLLLAGAGAALLAGPTLSWDRIGVVGASAFVLLLGLPALLVREPPPETRPSDGRLLDVARAHAAVFASNGLVVMAGTAVLMTIPYVAERVLERPREYAGTLNAFLLAGIAVGAALVALLSSRVAPARLLQGAAAAAAATLGALVATSPAVAWWHAGLVVVGVLALMSMVVPALLVAALADRAPGREGACFGVNGAALNVGCALAAASVTALVDAGRVRGVLALVAALLAAATLLLARVRA